MEVTHYVDTRTFKNQRQAGPAGTLLAFLLDLSGAQLCRAGWGRGQQRQCGASGCQHCYGDTTAYDIVNSIPDSMLGAIFVGMLIGSIAALCWALFVVYPLNVGRCRYFMESRQSLTPVSTVVSTFRRPYGNPIVVQLLTDLKIALGFLLLIVPGIYWEYCYELVPYLLAENPYMSATRAMELSKEMMEGEKWNFFILKLSFFGWLLLCVFTFGIGGFFLEPYMQATYAEFYAAMRSKALAMGMTTTDELGGFVRHDTYPNDMDF